VQLALTPDGRWDFAAADLVAAATTAGFTAVGINADRLDAAGVEAYAAAGVRCHESGARKSQLYYYLTEKSELVAAGIDRQLERLLASQPGLAGVDSMGRIERWARQVLRMHRQADHSPVRWVRWLPS
jgi:hypothetical protein